MHGLTNQLQETTVLTPAQREAAKTPQQRAEDVIYTLNHALTCLTVTDFVVAPAIGALSERWFGKRLDVCGHDHGHDHSHPHDHDHGAHGHAHAGDNSSLLKRAGSWFIGEAVGDVGAVLVTLPMQRYFPGVMEGMRRVMEPVVGGFFWRGSEHAAKKWGESHGYASDSREVVLHAQKLYEYEVPHLPQMAVWTASAVGINYGVMKAIDPAITLSTFAKGKAVGTAVTAALVFGARALAPDKAHAWDQTAGKHVVVPLTKKIGKLFGVEEHEVDAHHAARAHGDAPARWSERVKQPSTDAPEMGNSRSA